MVLKILNVAKKYIGFKISKKRGVKRSTAQMKIS